MGIKPAALYEEAAHGRYFAITQAAEPVSDQAQPWERAVPEPSVESEILTPALRRTNEDGTHLERHEVGLVNPTAESSYVRSQSGRISSVGVLRVMAWSATASMPYQQRRHEALADALGVSIVAPNTFGQGKKAIALNGSETQAMRRGDFVPAAAHMTHLALQSGIANLDELVIVAESQGPSLVPGIIRSLPDDAPLSHVILFSPVGAQERRSHRSLIIDMMRNGARGMKQYRALNPDWLSTNVVPDTNVVTAVSRQPKSHLLDYPAGMARGTMYDELVKALNVRPELAPTIHTFAGEYDGVAQPIAVGNAIERARRQLAGSSQADIRELTILPQHHHAYGEYTPYLAALIGTIIRPEGYAR